MTGDAGFCVLYMRVVTARSILTVRIVVAAEAQRRTHIAAQAEADVV